MTKFKDLEAMLDELFNMPHPKDNIRTIYVLNEETLDSLNSIKTPFKLTQPIGAFTMPPRKKKVVPEIKSIETLEQELVIRKQENIAQAKKTKMATLVDEVKLLVTQKKESRKAVQITVEQLKDEEEHLNKVNLWLADAVKELQDENRNITMLFVDSLLASIED